MTVIQRSRRGLRSVSSMFGAFVRVDYVDEVSYPASFLMGELATFVPVITTFFIGQLTLGSANSELFGDDYFTFAVLGLAIAGVMQSALFGFGFSLQRAQERGTLETLLVEPVPWTVLPIAMNVWRVGIGVANGLLVLLLGWLLGARYELSGLPVFLLLIAMGLLASQAIGILAASFLVLAKRSTGIVRLYTLLASILAGSVFSVDQLPPWLSAFSFAIPHTYAVTAAREQLMADAGSFTIPVGVALWFLTGFAVIVGGGGVLLFQRTLKYARKMGMLSGY
jgi:ABC-2 type transport system permease protein